ncbi:MAG: hypothetical protein DWP97_11640 [Calditrichaeota bacterium]|nr:MAG: hypothetical protein DWP97_11640 [Calditrichota bacterium]
MSLETGRTLGPYKIIEKAGAGGMGEVYKAQDTRLDRIVAIKVLPATFALNDDIKQRFEREAKTISSLNHPNICTLYDVGEQDGLQYLVMEFIEGETLADRIKRGPVQMKEFLEISIQVADALDKAHRQGLIHRDLKPGNIMLTKTGTKLLDFGLAKIQMDNSAPGVQSITQTTPLTGVGTLLGTMQYMAPEQLEGSEADTRSDIFSFGATMYEMATGAKAFGGGSQASLIASILKEEPRSVSEISPLLPPILEQTISQCIAKDPEQRWQSVADLKRSLQWIADGKIGSQGHGLIPQNRSTRETIIMAAMLCFFIISSVFGYLYLTNDAPQGQTVRSLITANDETTIQSSGGGHLSISPDGSKLVYLAEDSTTKKEMLWVRPLNSLKAVQLQGTEGALYPFWSPDSKQIGFFADGKMKKLPAIGGPVLTLCETSDRARGGSWNSDNVIIFSRGINDPIHKVSAAGGEPAAVTEMDTSIVENSQRFPYFLPDGKHFLYFSRVQGGDGGEKDAICLSSIEDPSVTRLFLAKSNAIYEDGYIYYMRESFLMVQEFDESSLETIGDPFPVAEEVLFARAYNKGSFTISMHSDLIYEQGVATDGSMLLIRSKGKIEIDTVLSGDNYFSADFSPDEQNIVMTHNEVNSDNSAVWFYDFNSKVKTRFTFGDSRQGLPFWTPDGEYIVYTSDNGDTVNNKFFIYKKHASGIHPETLLVKTDANGMIPNSITSDGKEVICQEFTSNSSHLYSVDVETGRKNMIFDSTLNCGWGAVSPNKKWLAYLEFEDNEQIVYITTYPTPSGKWQVSKGEGNMPRWNSDGTLLYHINKKNQLLETEIDDTGSFIKIGKTQTLFTLNPVTQGEFYKPYNDDQRFLTFENFSSNNDNKIILVQNYKQEFINK